MKEKNPAIRVVAVEPLPGHKVQGLKNMKESYVPGIFDRYALDEIVHVKDEDAFEAARRLAREEGIFAGMSSGAAMAAGMQIASVMEEGVLVAILPDGGDRYLSTNLFTTMLEPDFRFYNLLERRKVEFKPVKEGKGAHLRDRTSAGSIAFDFRCPAISGCRPAIQVFSGEKFFGR